jgi:hypothetical protein
VAGLYPMSGDEYDELLGVYALHSTGRRERDAVQAHLGECPRCRAEVKLHHETAALLGGGGSQAPPALWGRIVRAMSEHPPGPILRPPATVRPNDAPASRARQSGAGRQLNPVPGTPAAGAPGAPGPPAAAHGASSLIHRLRALRRRLWARR